MNLFMVQVPPGRPLLKDPAAVRRLIQESPEGSSQRLDLDESWAGLHFTLTGSVPIPRHEALRRGLFWDDTSLESVLMGGMLVAGGESWGPARYLAHTAVQRLEVELAVTGLEAFLKRYDPEGLMEEGIPPGAWDEGESAREWLADSFLKLRDFYKRAAAAGSGILICMT